MVLNRVITAVIVGLLLPVPSEAQNESHWGVAGSFTPSWSTSDTFRNLRENLWGIDPEADVSLEGTEFTIGFVRGSTRGGEWGVSYVRKPFKDGARFHESDESDPCTPTQCSRHTSTVVTRDVRLQGVEFHWFRPFVTAANRVQVGVNIAGGVASVKGNADETIVFEDTITFPGFPTRRDVFTDTFSGSVKDFEFMYSVVPLLKLEVQGAVIVAPGLKIKVAGGLNMPALSMRVGLTYLFGAP
jgi:hypothetical protein